jgi:hypothetical protein
VLKFARLPESDKVEAGAASIFRGGEAGKREYFDAVSEQVSAGAFFDALTAQQDRNKGNVLWYPEKGTIYLIDHSFSLARPGDNRGESLLLSWREHRGDPSLTKPESTALEKLLASDDLLTLRRFVEADRAEALAGRAQAMFKAGRVGRDF